MIMIVLGTQGDSSGARGTSAAKSKLGNLWLRLVHLFII